MSWSFYYRNVNVEVEKYMESLVRVSLLLVSEDFSHEVQRHGFKMLEHLWKYRSGKLSSADHLNLTVQLVSPPNELALKRAKTDSGEAVTKTEKPKEHNKHDRSLLVLAAKNSSKSLVVERTGARGNEDEDADEVQGNDETLPYHQGMGCLLLTEHNFLCEAFVIATSCSGIQQHMRVLPCLIDSLNKLWAQMEWNNKYVQSATGLGRLFSDDLFLKMAYYVVKFYEEEFRRNEIEGSNVYDIFSIALLQQIIPLFLRLMKCIHALWHVETDVGLLPEEIERGKSLTCVDFVPDGLYDTDDVKCFRENQTATLLEGTRKRVYNVIGLCTCIKGALPELLGSLVSKAFMEDLVHMEFRHLGMLIQLLVIPVVKHCTRKFGKEWMVNFIKPILFLCEQRLHLAWFSLLHNKLVENLCNYGNLVGSDEQIKEMKHKLLLEFTRQVSGLFGVLALQDDSLFRFLLHNDCFGELRMSFFGYFVDDEAAIKAIPFWHSLIKYAFSVDDVRFKLLIVEDLLPCLIRRLDYQLQCATQRLVHKLRSSASGSASQDLLVLCQDLYVHFLKDSVEEGNGSSCAENNFTSWLARKKEDLHVKASSAPKELLGGSDWNWEFEDEFQRYLPAYMEMLQQVDSMDDSEELDYFEEEALFQKLMPEFRSKYGINSCTHPYMLTISSLRQQQANRRCGVICYRKEGKFFTELMKLKPYIKASGCCSSIIDRLQGNSQIPSELLDCDVLPSLGLLHDLLFFWEPIFHPLIRKSHMPTLLWIIDQFTKANEGEDCLQVVPAERDFEPHLQPYAYTYFETKINDSMYHKARGQICLHKEFDSYLASGIQDQHVDELISSKDDFVKNSTVKMKFPDLNLDLIKLSLERRAIFVKMQHQVRTYSVCLRSLLEDELTFQLKGQLEVLMNELNIEGFFDIDNDCQLGEAAFFRTC